MNTSKKTASPWLILVTVVIATLLVGIDRTVTNIALPHIIGEFHIDLSTASWIVTAYIVTNAIFIPVFGKLADMFGNYRVYVLGLLGFIIVSVLTGLAWSASSIIVFRGFQGLVGAAVYPTGLAILSKSFTDKLARAQAVGIWSGALAASASLGPLIGGPLIDHFSWRMVFYINLPIGLIALLMVWMYLPHDEHGSRKPFDYLGASLLSVALFSLMLVLDRGSQWGWFSFWSVLAYVLTLVFGYTFIRVEKGVESPLIDLNFFKNKTVNAVLTTSFLAFGVLYTVMLLLSLFTQSLLHYDATRAGYLYLPLTLSLLVVSPLGARISRHFPPRWPIALGLFLGSIGIFLLAHANIDAGLAALIFPLVLLGIGLGIGMAPITTAMTSNVPKSEIGAASGLLNLTRSIAGAIGIAVFSSLYTFGLTKSAPETVFRNLYIVAAIVVAASALVALTVKESTHDYDEGE